MTAATAVAATEIDLSWPAVSGATAYLVDSSTDNATWTQIAAAWEHKKGDGLNIVIPPGLMVSGKLVSRAAKNTAPAPA